jgi:hypothetical protein
MAVSPKRREEILTALRMGTVPQEGLDFLAVGLSRFEATIDEELRRVQEGGSGFKAVRGDYGCGKTFFSRWVQQRARKLRFATTEVQISETETPLHKLETVYRRMLERLTTPAVRQGAFRSIIEAWFFALEEDVLSSGKVSSDDAPALLEATNQLMEKRLEGISRTSPAFASALRGYRVAMAAGDASIADGLLAWLAGQPTVSANVKRAASLKGEVDHDGALNFLQALLLVLRDSGHPGLVFVLDEVETLQRVRSDAREKALNALRQLMDELDGGRFPGLYLVITGTPSFFDGPQGAQKLAPLAQRLHTDFATDARFDNPRAPQIRLKALGDPEMMEVGRKVRDLYAADSKAPDRIKSKADDETIHRLAIGVAGKLGGKTGIAPRLFLKKLVADVLDRIDLYPDFDPGRDYQLTLKDEEMTEEERNSAPATSVNDIKLKL